MSPKPFLRILCVMSLISQTVCGIAFAQSENLDGLRAQALDDYHEGRYGEAAQLYNKIVLQSPKDASVLRDLMWVLWKDEQFEKAGKVAAQLLAVRKDDPEAKNILSKAPTMALRAKANADYHAGRYAEANKLYHQLADQEPQNVSILKDLMWSSWETGNYDEARDTASQILRLDKGDEEAKSMLEKAPIATLRARAVANYRSGNYQEALNAYQSLLQHSPNSASVLKDMYWCYWQMGRYKDVEDVAAKLTKLFPNDPESWNQLGRAQVANEHLEDGLKSYKRSLALNPNQPNTQRIIGRLHVDLREFDSAIDVLGDLENKDPSIPSVYPQLAKAQYFKGQYSESAKNWAKAEELYPQNDNYKVHEARSLYYNGQVNLALAKLNKIANSSSPMKWLSIDFLVDDALSRHDAKAAAKILEDNLKSDADIGPLDEPRLFKLAGIYFDYHMRKEGYRTIDRFLKINPTSIPALLMKADALSEDGHDGRAVKLYRAAIKMNPYSIGAREGLADAELARGNRHRALKIFLSAYALNPTDPYLTLLKSHYLIEAGLQKKGKKVLLDYLKNNPDRQVVPVLLYHGLTPFERDPILAYPVHTRTRVFEDHLRALKAAGYTPITSDQVVAWYKKKGTLPKKPVLISFDDGRLDSFRYGDPILKKYNFKATMFVPVENIEGHMPPAYVSWGQIVQFQNSGRWELEAHGDRGHGHIDIDPTGRQGLFLVNRQWFAKENRYETIKEWEDRVVADHQSSKNKIVQVLHKTPLSFAYPEGTYGQIDITNSPEAVPVNLSAARKEFQAAYHQDRFGINVRSKDTQFLTRMEPRQDWSGEYLVRYLQDQNPYVLMLRRLLWLAVWNDKPKEAEGYLRQLKDSGASQVVLLGEEARIRSSLGDIPYAWKNLEKAKTLGGDKDNDKLRAAVNVQKMPLWSPAYTFSEDDRNRRSSIVEQTLRPFTYSKFNLGFDYRYGQFHEKDVPSVTQNGAGLDFISKLSLSQTLSGRAMYYWSSTRVETRGTYGATLDLDSRWTDYFETELRGGRALYEPARALQRGVTENYADVYLLLKDNASWRISTKFEGANVSDNNRRYGVDAVLSKNLFANLRAEYKYTADNMDKYSTDYYSPQHLQQHQLGLEFAPQFRWFEPVITYLPGVGRESGTRSEFIQDIEAAITFHLGARTTLQPYYNLIRTPTYRRSTYNVLLIHRFDPVR